MIDLLKLLLIYNRVLDILLSQNKGIDITWFNLYDVIYSTRSTFLKLLGFYLC